MVILPLTLIMPLPVVYAKRIPFLPTMRPPVGKSGPLTICSNFSSSAPSMRARIASEISIRLCGGILVDIPTAMPEEPFIRRLGLVDGRTEGSFNVPSKFGRKSTVSSFIFFSMSSAKRVIRHSV